jgi:hypothetical protein
MINRAGIFDAQLARHGNPLPPHRICVNSKERPLYAAPTQSRTWRVIVAPAIEAISLTSSNAVQIQFTAQANAGYRIEYRESLSTGVWQPLVVLDPIPSIHPVTFTDPVQAGAIARFYRLVTW